MLRLPLIFACLVILSPHFVFAQASKPAEDAAVKYLKAGKLVAANCDVNIMCPSSSNMTYPDYSPFSAEWLDTEKADYAANVVARDMVHAARPIEHATWPPFNKAKPNILYLNLCRALANEIADAALYQHLQGDDAAAIESIRDLLHFSDMLGNQPENQTLVRLLVSEGIRALAMDRLNVITSTAGLTKDSSDEKKFQVQIAQQLILNLLKHVDPKDKVSAVARAEGSPINAITKPTIEKIMETERRVIAEEGMAAISLACHLYQFDNGGWPKSLDDLRAYLPNVPIDPFGDGKQTLGYALIKTGLPDGADRPLVYSRFGLTNGLYFRKYEPAYSFYRQPELAVPAEEKNHGGQFRDVAGWAPTQENHPAPTTQPLQ